MPRGARFIMFFPKAQVADREEQRLGHELIGLVMIVCPGHRCVWRWTAGIHFTTHPWQKIEMCASLVRSKANGGLSACIWHPFLSEKRTTDHVPHLVLQHMKCQPKLHNGRPENSAVAVGKMDSRVQRKAQEIRKQDYPLSPNKKRKRHFLVSDYLLLSACKSHG